MTKILSVDDSSTMREVVKLALKLAGFEVSQATDGAEALKMALAGQYDLVLADVNMPNMDGIELIRALRAEENYKKTPILMLTTESDLVRRHEGKSAGATGWIVKPFLPDRLVEAVNKALGKTAGQS
jgi:two-component system, chemotaxis family, chemotaxis protein CheY